MKKFIFKLETALAVRRSREGSLKRELQHACQKWSQAKEKERMLNSQIGTLIEEIQRKRAEGNLDLQETYAQILENLQESLAHLQQTLLIHQRQMEGQKGRLKEAVLERKVVEKIREKHYAGWRLREARSEGALLDEIALRKASEIK